ncbi:MAG TPA: STAS domain-containing protein [Anaerolineales bacterium]
MDDFSVKHELNGNVAVVTVSGRVDSFTASMLDTELAKIVRENKQLVLDLKEVVYMSSAGVRAIVRTLQTAQKSNGGVSLACVTESVETVLRTVGMLELLKVYPSVDEAVASF